MPKETTTAVNRVTGERRTFTWDVVEQNRIALGLTLQHDECTGPCRCCVEPDLDACTRGWPAKSLAAGLV